MLFHIILAYQTIYITISDINDNPPVFRQDRYEVSLPEEEAIGAYVAEVIADDLDSDAQLKYTVLPVLDWDFFYADSIFTSRTGVIKVNRVSTFLSILTLL